MVASAERRRRYCTPHLSPYLQTAPTHTDFFVEFSLRPFFFGNRATTKAGVWFQEGSLLLLLFFTEVQKRLPFVIGLEEKETRCLKLRRLVRSSLSFYCPPALAPFSVYNRRRGV